MTNIPLSLTAIRQKEPFKVNIDGLVKLSRSTFKNKVLSQIKFKTIIYIASTAKKNCITINWEKGS